MYLKVPVPANKGTRLLLRSTNASHLLLLISEPRLGWLDHKHPAAAQPKSPWEHPPADHPHRPGSHQQSHCPLSSFQKLNFAAHFDQIFYLKHMRSPPKHNLSHTPEDIIEFCQHLLPFMPQYGTFRMSVNIQSTLQDQNVRKTLPSVERLPGQHKSCIWKLERGE